MSIRPVFKLARVPLRAYRSISTTPRLLKNERIHENIDEYRKSQIDNPLTPLMTNTNSTILNDMPSIGKDERMTGGTQEAEPKNDAKKELDVGELEDVSFRVDPIKRTGEDANTMRARLLCVSLRRLFPHA